MGLHLGAGVKYFYKVVAPTHPCQHGLGLAGTPNPCQQLILSDSRLSQLFGFAVLVNHALNFAFP